jgi:hypothetical protein
MNRFSIVTLAIVALTGCSQNSEPASPGQEVAASSIPGTAMQAAPQPSPRGNSAGMSAAAPAATAAGSTKAFGPFHLSVPQGWTETPPKSSMRKAQYSIGGGAGPAELAVFYFGQDQGGSVEANISRWIGQFKQPDGSATRAVRREKQVDGIKVTLVNVKGRFVASMMPGQAAKFDEPEYEMLGAIVETGSGPYFFKMVGPEATVTAAAKDFDGMIDSIARN